MIFLASTRSRAARGLLDWTAEEPADAARIVLATVRLFEGEAAETRIMPDERRICPRICLGNQY